MASIRLCGDYLSTLWQTDVSISQLSAQAQPITPIQAAIATKKLESDVIGDCEAAILTFSDAVGRLGERAFSWSIVKLYYATFYAVRSLLAYEGICVFYLLKKPVWARINPGERPNRITGRLNGTTHGAIFSTWACLFSGSTILSGSIEDRSPFEWLKLQREFANYHQCGFPDPSEPSHCKQILKHGPRKLLNLYAQESNFALAFDPDHAVLAYPFLVIRRLLSRLELNRYRLQWTDEKKNFAFSLFKDSMGPIPILAQEIQRVYA